MPDGAGCADATYFTKRSCFKKSKPELKSLGIDFDAFVNPNSVEDTFSYHQAGKQLMSGIIDGQQYKIRQEKMPVEAETGQWCYGGWLSGHCPACGEESGSFFCESCGDHYEAAEILNPVSRRTGQPVGWKTNPVFYVELKNDSVLREYWNTIRVPEHYFSIADRYLEKKGATMRLTVPGNYGVQWSIPDSDTNQILFSYSSLLYTAHLLTGEVYSRLTGKMNPFEYGSQTKLFSALGVDNTVPFLVGVTGCALGQNQYRPFDKLFFNHFLKLEGKKFSTSRGHVIWAGELAKTSVNTDLVRLYLSTLGLQHRESDFLIRDFIRFHNSWAKKLEEALQVSTSMDSGALSEQLLESFLTIATELKAIHFSSVPDYQRYADIMNRWLNVPVESRNVWWLKMWAWICSPVLPDYSSWIWERFGEKGTPNLASLFQKDSSIAMDERKWALPEQLNYSDIEICLPETLTVESTTPELS